MSRGLLTRDSAEHGADRHPESREISLLQDIPRHDLARRADVRQWLAAFHQHARTLIYFHTQIRKRDSWPKWIRIKRRCVDPLGALRFLRRQARRPAVGQYGVSEGPS